MKPISFPKLTLPDSGSRGAPTLGHPLVDDYLESVHERLRPNSTLVGHRARWRPANGPTTSPSAPAFTTTGTAFLRVSVALCSSHRLLASR